MKIVAQGSGKVLDAAMSDATVIVWEDNGGDNQLWYFDEHAAAEFQEKLPHSQTLPLIRNKNFPDLVLDFHWMDYEEEGAEWGKVYLHDSVHGGYNQRFMKDAQGNIICLGTESEPRWDLRLDIIADDPMEAENGAKVGCYRQEKSGNQKWDFVYVDDE